MIAGNLGAQLNDVVTLDQLNLKLNVVKSDMVREFEKTVSKFAEQFTKLEAENKDLKKRVADLESQFKTASTSPDPAFKRINFIGFPLANELGRVNYIKKWLADHFDGLTCNVGNISKGPMKNRSLTSISYAEFSDGDMRNTVLKEIQSKNLACKYNGSSILIKPCLTQLIRERIWTFNTAHDLIKAHQAANGKTVVLRKDSNRAILVQSHLINPVPLVLARLLEFSMIYVCLVGAVIKKLESRTLYSSRPPLVSLTGLCGALYAFNPGSAALVRLKLVYDVFIN